MAVNTLIARENNSNLSRWRDDQRQCQFHRHLLLILPRFQLPDLAASPAHVLRGRDVLRTHGVPAAPIIHGRRHCRCVGIRRNHGLDSSTCELQNGQRSS